MKTILDDSWVLLGLAFGQVLLSFVFVTFLPYGYLVIRSESNSEIKQNLDKLAEIAEAEENQNLDGAEFFEKTRAIVRDLVTAVPWFFMVLCASILIYPFLGWWCGKLLHNPQAGGFLVVISVLLKQNVCMVPHNFQYWNVAPVALGLIQVCFVIGLQCAMLLVGIFAQRGQILLEQGDAQ